MIAVVVVVVANETAAPNLTPTDTTTVGEKMGERGVTTCGGCGIRSAIGFEPRRIITVTTHSPSKHCPIPRTKPSTAGKCSVSTRVAPAFV